LTQYFATAQARRLPDFQARNPTPWRIKPIIKTVYEALTLPLEAVYNCLFRRWIRQNAYGQASYESYRHRTFVRLPFALVPALKRHAA
jgi:hypothetical protein